MVIVSLRKILSCGYVLASSVRAKARQPLASVPRKIIDSSHASAARGLTTTEQNGPTLKMTDLTIHSAAI